MPFIRLLIKAYNYALFVKKSFHFIKLFSYNSFGLMIYICFIKWFMLRFFKHKVYSSFFSSYWKINSIGLIAQLILAWARKNTNLALKFFSPLIFFLNGLHDSYRYFKRNKIFLLLLFHYYFHINIFNSICKEILLL